MYLQTRYKNLNNGIRLLLLIIFLSILSGCYTPPPGVQKLTDYPVPFESLVGLWMGKTAPNQYNYGSDIALLINLDGTAEFARGSLFTNIYKGADHWIYSNKATIQSRGNNQWSIILGEKVVHSGADTPAWGKGSPEPVPILFTQEGLIVDGKWTNDSYLKRRPTAIDPVVAVRNMMNHKRGLGHGASPQNSDANLHLMTSAMQFGAGVAAMSDGNQAAAQQAFTAAQNQSAAGIQGQAYDYNQAAQEAFRTGVAIGSDGQSIPNFPNQNSGTTAPNTINPSQAAKGQSAIVPVDSLMITAYTDGKAYDLLVVVPYNGPGGKTAGEFCFYYGMTKANALTLLQNSYAATGTLSAYGAGNPRAQISYRSYPVSLNQSIKYGMEWKVGQMVFKPHNFTAYGTLPLR